jgi:transposase
MDLTSAKWEKLKPLLAPKRRSDGRGRPRRDAQAVLNGVLWVLRKRAPGVRLALSCVGSRLASLHRASVPRSKIQERDFGTR